MKYKGYELKIADAASDRHEGISFEGISVIKDNLLVYHWGGKWNRPVSKLEEWFHGFVDYHEELTRTFPKL